MDVDAVKAVRAAYPDAASRQFGPPSNVLVYRIRGRKFAWFRTSEPERWRFGIRVSPERFVELTDVPGIKPARCLARLRRVAGVDVSTMPGDCLHELIERSCTAARSRLSNGPGRQRRMR